MCKKSALWKHDYVARLYFDWTEDGVRSHRVAHKYFSKPFVNITWTTEQGTQNLILNQATGFMSNTDLHIFAKWWINSKYDRWFSKPCMQTS